MSEPPAVVGLVDSREQRDDVYRAIGRYTVEFSLLVAGMREIIAVHVADEQRRDDAQLVLGSLMAQQVADPFFAICRAVGELNLDEQTIEKLLRKHVNEEIEERNRIMHGDWLIARWTRDDFKAPTAARVRVSARNVNEPVQQRNFTVVEIDEICERVAALKNVVWEFGTICTKQWVHAPDSGRPAERVRDALHIVEGRVAHRLGDRQVLGRLTSCGALARWLGSARSVSMRRQFAAEAARGAVGLRPQVSSLVTSRYARPRTTGVLLSRLRQPPRAIAAVTCGQAFRTARADGAGHRTPHPRQRARRACRRLGGFPRRALSATGRDFARSDSARRSMAPGCR